MESVDIPALAHQPTRRFWAETEETKLEDGWRVLESRWHPRRVDLEGAEGTPSSYNGTGVPEGVVEKLKKRGGGISQFGDQHSGAIRGE